MTVLVFFVLVFTTLSCGLLTDSFNFSAQVDYNGTAIQAAFVSGYIHESSVFFVSPLGVAEYDLNTQTFTSEKVDTTFVTSLKSVVYNPILDEIWATTRSLPPKIVRFNSKLQMVSQTSNPLDVPELTQSGPATVLGSHLYVLNQKSPVALLRWDLNNEDLGQYESLPLGNFTPTTIQKDTGRAVLYIGTRQGVALVVTLSSNYTSSTVVPYTLFSDGEFIDIATSFIDLVHGSVYYVSSGGQRRGVFTPAQVARQQINTPSLITNISFGDQDINAGASVIDETGGVAYVAFYGVSPGKIGQISLAPFEVEVTSALPRSVSQLTPEIGFWFENQIIFASIQPTRNNAPALVYVQPASACVSNCFGRGLCDFRTCYCSNGTSPFTGATLRYLAPSCQYLDCDQNCTGHGTCSAVGTCNCLPTWTDRFCATPRCPNDCTSLTQGSCNFGPSGEPINCTCTDGWTGEDCSTAVPVPVAACPDRVGCTDCLALEQCGWCQSSQKCSWGNAVGPLQLNASAAQAGEANQYLTCQDYFYDTCPNVGFLIVNSILTILILFMWVVNVGSSVAEESSPLPASKRDDWYRFMRSYKAHQVLYQVQFIASLGFVGKTLPSALVSFIRWWNWALLAAPLPWFTDGVASSRSLLSIDEYYISSNILVKDTFFSITLVWFAAFMGVSLVLFALSLVVGIIRGKDTDRLKVGAQGRAVYVVLRVIDLSYYPIVFMSAAAIANSKGTYLGVAAFFWVLIGVLYPLGIFVFMFKQDTKRIFLDAVFSRQFQVFWGVFDHAKLPFVSLLQLLPRFVIGSAVGFGTITPLAQLIIPLLVFIALIVITFVVKPYRDYVQEYATTVSYASQIICILTLFGLFGTNTSASGIAVVFTLFTALGIVSGFVFFVICWLHLHEIYTLKQCLSCKKSSDKASDE